MLLSSISASSIVILFSFYSVLLHNMTISLTFFLLSRCSDVTIFYIYPHTFFPDIFIIVLWFSRNIIRHRAIIIVFLTVTLFHDAVLSLFSSLLCYLMMLCCHCFHFLRATSVCSVANVFSVSTWFNIVL